MSAGRLRKGPIDATLGKFLASPFGRRFKPRAGCGLGGMGIVLRAWDRECEREVAIKLMRSERATEELFERFKREGIALAKLQHPNIVKVYQSGFEGDIPYLVMQYIEGYDLDNMIRGYFKKKKKQPSIRWITQTLAQVAEALVHCHEQGILHRDLKPNNIIIEKNDNRPVLVDFGIAKKISSWGDSGTGMTQALTRVGVSVGTPTFMSPEQIGASDRFGQLSPKSDVWSLGATLFFCLTGTTPYKDQPLADLIYTRVTKEPRRAKDLNKKVPDWLDELCSQSMRLNSDERPGMAELAQELHEGASLRDSSISEILTYREPVKAPRSKSARGKRSPTGSQVMKPWGPPEAPTEMFEEAPRRKVSMLRRLFGLALLAGIVYAAITVQPIRQPLEAFLRKAFGG